MRVAFNAGDETEEHARGDRERRGEAEHAPVDAEIEDDALVGRRDEGHQRRAESAGQDRAAGRARRREQQALGEQLPDDAAARRAEAETHGDLPLARARSGEQQVGEVGARDHQDERCGPEQQPQRRLVLLAQPARCRMPRRTPRA